MLKEGVATRADKLSVDVKLNAARVDLTKVDNGLVLSRMALAQLCGMPLDSPMLLADENIDDIDDTPLPARSYDMQQVYEQRPDLKALQMGINIAGQQKKVAMASMMPNLAVVGTYSFSNPNMFDGFSKKFKGAFSVGAMLTIPIWHWGGNYNKYKAAESEETVMKLKMQGRRGHGRQCDGSADRMAQSPLRTHRRAHRRASLRHISLQSARHTQLNHKIPSWQPKIQTSPPHSSRKPNARSCSLCSSSSPQWPHWP